MKALIKISHVLYLCLVLTKPCANYLYYFSGYKERFLKLSLNYFTQTFKISFFLTISHNDTIKAILRFTMIYIYIYIYVTNTCTFILIFTNICTFIWMLPIFQQSPWHSWLWASNGEGLVFESRPYKHKYKSLRICQGPETKV